MVNDIKELQYSVGALLYSPALNEGIAKSIVSGQFGSMYSVALCLEDTIADAAVEAALDQLVHTFDILYQAFREDGIKLPKLFVRVRNAQQIEMVYQRVKEYCSILTGFIFPKYSLDNADVYNAELLSVIHKAERKFFMMPILESEDIINFDSRPTVLSAIKKKIDVMKPHVLNVRVGGNDFSNAFGIRRHSDETIYDILPIAQLLCDILTVFSREYVVSGPVWEYYSGNDDAWKAGLQRELKYDLLNGFVGKTVIHPNQIAVVNEALKVTQKDYDDAKEILSWNDQSALLVGGSSGKERMNEVNTHRRWAHRTAVLAAIYGVKEE